MKTKLIIAVATLAIVFGLYGLAGKLQVPAPAPVAVGNSVEPETTVKVWFVDRDVQSGEMFKRSDLQVKMLVESAANRLGISEDVDLKFVKGAVYNRAIAAKQAIFPEDLVAPQDIGFIDLVIRKNRIPFAIKVDNSAIVGGLINYGSYVDILALASAGDDLSGNVGEGDRGQLKSISVSPVLMGIKVLQVQHHTLEVAGLTSEAEEINLILELTHKQVAKLTIAKRIAELQVHKSIGHYQASDLSADAGDVLADYKAIKEFRANKIIIN